MELQHMILSVPAGSLRGNEGQPASVTHFASSDSFYSPAIETAMSKGWKPVGITYVPEKVWSLGFYDVLMVRN